jgi:tRNA_anti-like
MRTAPRAVTMLLMLSVVVGCNKPRSSSPPAEPPKPVATLTSDELIAEYQKNEVGADQKYKDKLIEVTGKVAEVKKDLFGRYFVGLGTAHEGEMFDVMCYLDPSAEADAGKLQKGETTTIKGLCQGRAGGIVLNLKVCVIVKK